MKKDCFHTIIGVVILLIAFSFQTLQKGWLLSDYLLHTEKYEALCVNKSKPKMHCDGKCQLSKKMVDTSDKNSTSKDLSSITKIFEYLFYQEITPISVSIHNSFFSKSYFLYCFVINKTSLKPSTHPPTQLFT